jgi:NDP-sugar pyrophosphorylase family protein
MAGGEGRRLEPFTKIVPKPLLYVDGKSMLERVVEFFREQGVGKIYLLTKYKADLIKAFVELSKIKDIEIVVEDEPLGTAGGLALIGDRLSSQFFVSNCDVLIDVDLRAFKDFCDEGEGADMGIVSFQKSVRVPYGIFEFDDAGDICDFLEKPTIQLWANAGVYLMTHRVFDFIKPGVAMGMDELFYSMLNSGSNVKVVPVDGAAFHDIGEFQYYKKVMEELC